MALLVTLLVAMLVVVAPGESQQLDSARAGIAATAPDDTLRPPITPRRAFLYSFLIPGAGQAKLDRANAGSMFFFIEITAIALAHRSAEDLRIARAFRGDSVPRRYDIDATTGRAILDLAGNPRVLEWSRARYDDAWVRTRRLHYEDWLAVIFFNHLFAGADAFVAAQLWDLPGRLAIRRTPFGSSIQASFSFR